MHAVNEINHLLKALDRFNAQVMVALDNEALTEFARILRGTPVAHWVETREGIAGQIHAFMVTPQEEWSIRWPDRLTRTALALAAWQLSQDLSNLLSELRKSERLRPPADPHGLRVLASEAVADLLQTQRGASLWPQPLGSPFLD